MAKSVGNIRCSATSLDALRPRRAGHVLRRRATTASRSPSATTTLGAGAAQRAAHPRGRAAARARAPRRTDLAPLARALLRRARRRLQHPAGAGGAVRVGPRGQPARAGVGDADLREMLDVLGLENLLDADGGDDAPDAEAPGAARARARRRAPRATSPRPTACATSCAARGWEVRDSRRRPRARARGRDRSTGATPSARRCAAAAPARPRDLGDAAARRREPWLRDAGRARARRRRPPTIARRCGSDGPPGRLRRGRRLSATSTRPTLLARPDPLIVALDEVQDPQNLGAICRTAECVGRDRRRDPRAPLGRGHAGGLQGLGGRGRAPARSRGCATSPTSSPRPRRPGCWCYGAAAGPRRVDYRSPTTRRGRARARRGGPGPAPARRRGLRRARRAAAARATSSRST